MTQQPPVAVIVPVFNGARFLAEALDSVLAQDYRPLEIIVVDDGSTDGSAEIAATREVLVIRQERRGVATARNVGIAAATAPILMLIDQDDLWRPGKARKQVDVLLAHPDRVCLTLQEFFLDASIAERPVWMRPELMDAPSPGWMPSCIAFTRSTFEYVGEFDPSYAQGSDSDWFARAKAKGVLFETIEESLVRHRLHDSNESGAVSAHRELLQVVRRAVAQRRK
ncbi:MAG TPA: glycosyltransferase family A protein [Thermoanaerobaculia bacterium]|nr:glycosyltransferase family A protein [Thermoanaerobaculia bacterium]